MYRHASFRNQLTLELRNPKFASEFLVAQMEGHEGIPLVEALNQTIRKMGINQFSQLSGIPSRTVVKLTSGRLKVSIPILDRFLKPLGLKTKVALELIE